MNNASHKVAVINRARGYASHCGDQGDYWANGHGVTLCMVDGLGHGEQAEEAARAALNFVARNRDKPLSALFQRCNVALRHTRGVAMAVAVTDKAARTLTYAAVGNVHGMIIGGKMTRLTSCNGIVGGGYKSLTTETLPLGVNDLVLLLTDGVKIEVDIFSYDDTLRADPDRLAETILNDWGLDRDDAGVLVYRNG